MPGDRLNWDVIEIDYIQGIQVENEEGNLTHIYPSYTYLGNKYGVNRTTICNRASRDDWQKKRNYYRLKLKDLKKDNNLLSFVSESATIDYYNIAYIKNVQQLLHAYLQPYMQMLDKETKELLDEEGNAVRLNMRDIKDSIATIDMIHNLSRKIYGEPLNADTLRQQIEDVKENKVNDEQLEDKIKHKLKELQKIEERKELVKKKKALQRAKEEGEDNIAA